MVIIILTNQLQSNILTNSYFPSYPNYSFKNLDPPWRLRRNFITLTRLRRSFEEDREGAGKGGKFGGRPWESREAMARRCRLGGAAAGARRHGGGCCAARSETEREERDWAVGLYLALPCPNGWRVTATP